MPKKNLLILLVLYVASSVVSYAGFRFANRGAVSGPSIEQRQAEQTESELEAESALGKLLSISPNEPRDQQCPLSGQLFTKMEKDAWEKHRPLAVMIENHPESRPQSGLSRADIVFEAMAEGGVTRFMGMFYCNVQAEDTTLAPIRSARSYFVDWASGFNFPLYVHVGGANTPGPANALGQIGDYGWNQENDLNQFSIGYPTFVRDYNRLEGKDIATEHTMVTTTEKLWKVADKREWTNMSPDIKVGKKVIPGTDWKAGYRPWSFQDGKAAGGVVNPISYEFWDGYKEYGVTWNYDSATNAYKRDMAGEAHKDLNNDEQIAAKNVVVLFSEEKGPIDEKKHLLYKTTGVGDALIFQNGEAIKAKWEKKDREAELIFKDAKGKEIQFVRGMTWISVVSPRTKVTY